MVNLTGETLLERYYLRELIDSGGMADVYLSWDRQRSVHLAVKILRRDLSRDPTVVKLFHQEAEILRKLEHPNIVRLYEFESDGKLAFLVMDWVEGKNLARVIQERRAPFSLIETVNILEPVCSALSYAHRNQIFHCDVKPANIMLHEDGRVLLTDFGVARLAGKGMDGGTPPYMAPEQFEDKPVDARTDVYALGVTLYEMLAGKLPFRGDSAGSKGSTLRERIEWEHRFLPVPTLRQANPGADFRLEQLVARAMNKEIAQRFPSVSAMLEAFNAIMQTKQAAQEDGKRTILGGNNPVRGPHTPPPVNRPPEVPNSPKKQGGIQSRQGISTTAGPSLYCRQGVFAGQQIMIPPQGLTIGRGSQCQLIIRESSVSRTHASIFLDRKGRSYIKDENSSAGTLLNGSRISSVVLLKPDDTIQLGYTEIFEFRSSKK